MSTDDDLDIQKVDGRSREARAARAAQQEPHAEAASTRSTVRQPARQTTSREPRSPSRGGAVVRGRDGEVLTRKRTGVADIFHIPPELIEPGYELQWIAVSVLGNTEVVMDQNLQMLENGWRPVDSSRFPGRFMPAGHKGQIIRGGQGLFERPKVLCDEARAEDVRLAKQLISDRNDSLKLSGVRNSMPDGFAMNGKYRGTGGDVRMSIDPALDIQPPSHTLAEPE